VQRSDVTQREGRGFATYDLRVPTSRLEQVLADLSRLTDVRSRTQSSNDITAPFVSARDRLDDARDEREALLKALAKAETDAEIESLKQRIRGARYRISVAQADVQRLQRRAQLSRVTVAVESTGKRSEGGAWTPGDAVRDAGARARGRGRRPRRRRGLPRAVRPARAPGPPRRAGDATSSQGGRPRVASATMATAGQQVVSLLASVPVFETLGREDLDRVAQVAVPRRFPPGQIIFREGDQSDTCYVVADGHARALREHGDGRTIALARFGPGDIFGELAMFDDERRSATVEALDDLQALAILGADFGGCCASTRTSRSSSSSRSGRRLRAANERLSRQSFQTVQSRVAGVLIGMVEQQRREGGPDEHVLLTTTQAEVAQLAGSSRESASRFLAVLERAGIVAQGRGKLTVHDPSALQRYVY
jgi:CRP/FNR family transcriptional regulator